MNKVPRKTFYIQLFMFPERFSKGLLVHQVASGIMQLKLDVEIGDSEIKVFQPLKVSTAQRFYEMVQQLDDALKTKAIVDYFRAIDPKAGDVCLVVCCDNLEMAEKVRKFVKVGSF